MYYLGGLGSAVWGTLFYLGALDKCCLELIFILVLWISIIWSAIFYLGALKFD